MGDTLATPCSNCVYKGTKYCGIFCGRSRFWFISLLLLAVSSWAACVQRTTNNFCPDLAWCFEKFPMHPTWCDGTTIFPPNESSLFCTEMLSYTDACANDLTPVRYASFICCDTQNEADSVQCVNDGNTWVNGECRGPIDSTVCDFYRAQCAEVGGVFEGEPLEDGCSATCNTCGNEANKKILELKSRSCCSQGLAPSIGKMCTTLLESGIGMTVSSNANLECSDPNLSDEALQSYVDNCSNNNNSNPESSESGPTSSEGGSSAAPDSAGLGQDYYPILDTMRDSLLDIRRNVETVTICLVSPGTCAGLMGGGDTVIVNASDSTYINQLGTKLDGLNSTLDTSVQNSNERLQESVNLSISRANDSLIDSVRKYLNSFDSRGDIQEMDSSNRALLSGLPGKNASAIGSALGYGDTASTNLRGDLNAIRAAIEGFGDGIGSGVAGALDSAIGSGSGADTAGVGYGWLADGDALADSIKAASGYNSLDFEADSALRDSLENVGYVCTDSTCCIGNQCVEFDSEKKIQDSLARFVAAYGDTLRQKNSEFLADSVDGMFQAVKDSLKVWNPVGIFDSTVLSTLGMKIPNTNTCPEHCSKFEVDIPFMFGTHHFTIDYGLCLGRAAFANGNVLSFLRFIIRIVVAFTCISAVMWNAARVKR